MGFIDFEGQRLAYVDEGEGEPILLLHGEPTWSYLWRNVISQLPGRKVAPDLIGFGRSDKPEDAGWYSYDRHVESVTRLVEELDLRGLTLVVHDWGGPIGLRFAVENPDRVARLAILDTGGGRAPSETWLRFRAVVRDRGRALDIGRLVEAGTTNDLTEPEHPNAAPMNRVADSLRTWTKPTTVIWGADDAVLPVQIARGIVDLNPGATGPVHVEGASHFLQEDRPDEVAAGIRALLAR